MRKWNNILVRVIIVLFLVHAFMGSLVLLGLSTITFTPLSFVLLLAVLVHAIFGVVATCSAWKSGKVSGRWYLRQNAAFWTKRISGLAILLLLGFHVTAYTINVNGKFFLREFTFCKMVLQLLFILAIFIHLFVSIKSMLIAKGVVKFKERMIDWILVLSVMTLFFVVAVVAYYIQWQV